jgi:hypothetical protein
MLKISGWVALIVSLSRGPEKLYGEQVSIAQSEVGSFIKLVFGNRIEFVADVAFSLVPPPCARGVGR